MGSGPGRDIGLRAIVPEGAQADLAQGSPPRRMGRPSRAETELLDRHLLDVAERLFLAHGFEATSMDTVAGDARASKRTIYHRHPSKDALFGAVIERAIRRLLDGAGEDVQGATVEARLEHLALGLVDRALRPDILALMRVVIADAHRFPGLAQSLDRRARGRVIAFVAGMMATETVAGRLRLAGTPEAAAEHFLGLTHLGLVMRALMGGDVAELRAEAAAGVRPAVRLFLHGCRPA